MKISKLLSVMAISLIALCFSLSPGLGDSDTYSMRFIVPFIEIDSYWNNVTGESLSISMGKDNTVEFGVTTSLIAENITWYNGTTFLENDTATSQGNLTHTFDTYGTFEIKANALNDSVWTGNTTFTVIISPTVNISGYIINVIDLPVENARIDINDEFTYTDSVGYYEIQNITSGTYDVTVRAIGYSNKYDSVDMTNSSISNYTMREKTNPTKAPGFEVIPSLVTFIIVLFLTKKRQSI